MKKKDEREVGEQRRGRKERETSSKERWRGRSASRGNGEGTGEPLKSCCPELRPAAASFLATRGHRSRTCRIFRRVFSEPGNHISGISTHKRQGPLGGQGHNRREVFFRGWAPRLPFLGVSEAH